MVEHDFFAICQYLPFLIDYFLKFHKLLAVNIWVDRSVVWRQLKTHNTFVIPPNWQYDLFLIQLSFWYGLCWFMIRWIGPWSFFINVIIDDPFFIASYNSFQKGSIALRLKWVLQILIRCVGWISFNSCGTQISSFLTSLLVKKFDFQLLCVIHLTVLQFLAQLYDDSILLLLSLCHHQLQKVDQNVGHPSVRNLQNEIFFTNSDTCVLLNN